MISKSNDAPFYPIGAGAVNLTLTLPGISRNSFGMKRKDYILYDVLAAVGSWAELARQLGITRAAVHAWQSVPIRHLRQVSLITGIPRDKLRPDLYR